MAIFQQSIYVSMFAALSLLLLASSSASAFKVNFAKYEMPSEAVSEAQNDDASAALLPQNDAVAPAETAVSAGCPATGAQPAAATECTKTAIAAGGKGKRSCCNGCMCCRPTCCCCKPRCCCCGCGCCCGWNWCPSCCCPHCCGCSGYGRRRRLCNEKELKAQVDAPKLV